MRAVKASAPPAVDRFPDFSGPFRSDCQGVQAQMARTKSGGNRSDMNWIDGSPGTHTGKVSGHLSRSWWSFRFVARITIRPQHTSSADEHLSTDKTVRESLRHHFHQCISTVSSAAVDRSIYSAVVWRRAVDLDELHVVFSDSAPWRISIRAFDQRETEASNASAYAFESASDVARVSPDCAE